MKITKILGVIIILLLCSASTPSISFEHLIGPTWKVNEYYVNYERYYSPTIDSIRYRFEQNGIIVIHKRNPALSANGFYSINTNTNRMTITGQNAMTIELEILALDTENFIFRTTSADPQTQQANTLEFRMIPDL